MTLKANPVQNEFGWWWYDENDFCHGPFTTQANALYDLLKYITGPRTFWEKLKDLFSDT